MISFHLNGKDFDLIAAIANRAVGMGLQGKIGRKSRSRVDVQMDVTAVHNGGTPLRLSALLAADDFNFTHDIGGIVNCLDRETGQLTNHFSPRFSAPVRATAA